MLRRKNVSEAIREAALQEVSAELGDNAPFIASDDSEPVIRPVADQHVRSRLTRGTLIRPRRPLNGRPDVEGDGHDLVTLDMQRLGRAVHLTVTIRQSAARAPASARTLEM